MAPDWWYGGKHKLRTESVPSIRPALTSVSGKNMKFVGVVTTYCSIRRIEQESQVFK
jgi:hypothetical protein